jgi:acetaldehyde dehydrogenase (acetylating)
MGERIKVAVIGTGNIGTDLCARMLLDSKFEVVAFAGRRADSPGLVMFNGKIPHIISNGIDGLLEIADRFEGFFDATSAYDHLQHWEKLSGLGKWAIDLTPSQVGHAMVPELIGSVAKFKLQDNAQANYSMVTCGGQSSAPLVFAMAKNCKDIAEVEISSSIAAKSAGPATRRNIDQYINSTENLVTTITDCKKVKAILVLNPAEPPVMMRTTVQMKVKDCNLEAVIQDLEEVMGRITKYVPGYEVVVAPHFSSTGVVSGTVKVTGAGYVLPTYAGNLDIINAAAVETAKKHVESQYLAKVL